MAETDKRYNKKIDPLLEDTTQAGWGGEDYIGPHNWKPVHTKILLMVNDGMEHKYIARKLDISTNTLSRVKTSSYFLTKLARLNSRVIEKVTEKRAVVIATDKARALLTKAAVPAAQQVIKLAASGEPQDRVKLLACQDILDRAGLRPIEIIETRERVYSPEEVVHARDVLLETQSIVERLANQTTPFVFNPSKKVEEARVVSSETDQAHDGPINREESPAGVT